MPPANIATLIPEPTLATVLTELREAVADLDDACADIAAKETDADDRATEAEQRIDRLRAEFDRRFLQATGLTWKQIEEAVSEAVL